MKIEKTLLVLVAAVVASGCGPNPGGTGGASGPATASTTTASSPPVAAASAASATALACAMKTQSVDTCIVRKSGMPDEFLACHLWVGGPPSQPFVYPYEVVAPVRPAGSPVVFVWHLLDRGLRFPSAASGPTMPMPAASSASSAFSDPSPTDDDEGATNSADPNARHFRWRFAHPGTAGTYSYTMQFESRIPGTLRFRTVSCDPTIKSSGN